MRRFPFAAASLALLLLLSACGAEPVGTPDDGLTPVSVCLEWTPNTNHTGLYAALALGYFQEAGLDVQILQPPEDGASALCAAGRTEFAVTAQDTLAAALAREEPLAITAVAAILQHDTSGILSRAGEGLDRPKGLEGRAYSTYNGLIELAMLQRVVELDGGDFSQVNLVPYAVTDEAGALREGLTDALWVYYGWGGIAAELAGVETDYFYFKDIDPVFDFYTPILVANNAFLAEQPETARAFLSAASRGYAYAIQNPEEAAQLLIEGDTTGSLSGSGGLVSASQAWMAGQYQADAERWGYIDPARWNAFYQWLNDNGLVEVPLPENAGFTNGFLPQ
nr:ABC transporter substrate-binding protein [uncultured Oscillibacter sp.]